MKFALLLVAAMALPCFAQGRTRQPEATIIQPVPSTYASGPTSADFMWFMTAMEMNKQAYADAKANSKPPQIIGRALQNYRGQLHERVYFDQGYGGGPVTVFNPFVNPVKTTEPLPSVLRERKPDEVTRPLPIWGGRRIDEPMDPAEMPWDKAPKPPSTKRTSKKPKVYTPNQWLRSFK